MSLNIFEIWDGIGRQTPFAVRRDHWGEEQHAVVERIECEKLPYGKAFGYPVVNGQNSDRFEYDEQWRNEKLIPCCGCYQWTFIEDAEINKDKKLSDQYRKRLNKALSIFSKLTFGKHKGYTVEQAFLQNNQYIEWALLNVEKFCLTKEAIHLLEGMVAGFKFPDQIKRINDQKLLLCLKE
ncbi:hypothetical protein A8C56_03885 [Niabella ginsenosidivorans]|uniref:Exodeoxyribonuclease X-like C-terminal domain-containing protein n=1 Tax=Niabella ginsenosidivorans TaxID=1176587 RepID=A0A1A9HXX7_9BACT|nr:hypothetical protein [Niabella ginsenosidivorans]ANH80236.1 hypothetical protein A8C56_03885 [Niabella ginsenosidivorans]